MTIEKTEQLYGRTDYAVKEVNLLMVMGAIPEEFVGFNPDKGIFIDYLIASFMEHFPKKALGDNWMQAFDNTIKYTCDLLKFEIAPRQGVRESEDGETSVLFVGTATVSRQLNIKKSKLDSLINWAISENPELQPLLMKDEVAGYVASAFLLNQLDRSGVRLDKFLKSIVSGKARFDLY